MNPAKRLDAGDRFAEFLALVAGIDARNPNVYGRKSGDFDETIDNYLLSAIDFAHWTDDGLVALMRLCLDQSSDADAKELARKIDSELAYARYYIAHGHCEDDAGHVQFARCAACAARGVAITKGIARAEVQP